MPQQRNSKQFLKTSGPPSISGQTENKSSILLKQENNVENKTIHYI
jgi:hypothetical protein